MADPGVLFARHQRVLEEADRLLSELGGEDQAEASRRVRQDVSLAGGERHALGDGELILALARIAASQHERISDLEGQQTASAPKSNTKR